MTDLLIMPSYLPMSSSVIDYDIEIDNLINQLYDCFNYNITNPINQKYIDDISDMENSVYKAHATYYEAFNDMFNLKVKVRGLRNILDKFNNCNEPLEKYIFSKATLSEKIKDFSDNELYYTIKNKIKKIKDYIKTYKLYFNSEVNINKIITMDFAFTEFKIKKWKEYWNDKNSDLNLD